MSLRVLNGNIFTTGCQTVVNTVNCVGVMGAGIALECRYRWPDMYKNYLELCKKEQLDIGKLWLYKGTDRWVLNFPTKRHWKEPSREEYLHLGLQKFMCTYQQKKIESIAFPLLGAQHGGLDQVRSQQIMESYLIECKIPVEIYRYDPMAPDDLFNLLKELLAGRTSEGIKEAVGLRADQAEKVLGALNDPSICQLNRLAALNGIGGRTVEKLFMFLRHRAEPAGSLAVQQTLDF